MDEALEFWHLWEDQSTLEFAELAPHPVPAVKSASAVARKPFWLSDDARLMGINIIAGKGSGKSLLEAQIALQDFRRGFPVLDLDPWGTTISYFFTALSCLPEEEQKRLWPKVRYVDMNGRAGRVFAWPFYFALGEESKAVIAGRFPSLLVDLYPHLKTASVMGESAIWRVGRPVGMVLAALGFQITEAADLLRDPLAWEERFEKALSVSPEVAPALEYLRWLGSAHDSQRYQRTEVFLGKVEEFLYDPAMRAMFGASKPDICWPEVEEQGLAVLVDFSQVNDPPQRALKMRWVYDYFMEYVHDRGPGRHKPISLIIDELTALLASPDEVTSKAFATELNQLINEIARNFTIWLTCCSQELFQHSEKLQKTLMTVGTQILGVTSDQEAALKLASQFFRYDPYQVKKYEPVWSSDRLGPMVVDHRSMEFTRDEQLLLDSYAFRDQGTFQFLVRPARGEGDVRGRLHAIEIAKPEKWPEKKLVDELRDFLMQRHGKPIKDVIDEIEARLAGAGDADQVLGPDERIPFFTD